ncbi:hypothetical protein BV20DRAFT_1058173 [Pilatotrama ljubarskyi]|nr:hypothetical protein BV20DRAFT_1058173 [Pilatotrama ljubarskyi]
MASTQPWKFNIINNFKPKNTAAWCKLTTISQALVFMLSNPGYNLPLLPAGAPIPPPELASEDEQDDGDSDAALDAEVEELINAQGDDGYDPWNARGGPPPSPSKSATTPARSKTPKMSVNFEYAPSTPSPSLSASWARGRFKEGSSSSSTVTRPSGSTPTRGSTLRGHPPPDPTEDLAIAVEDGLNLDTGREYLSRIVLPPPSMLERSRPALPSASDIIHVHSHNVKTFAYHAVMSLSWDLKECKELYEEIRFPEAY